MRNKFWRPALLLVAALLAACCHQRPGKPADKGERMNTTTTYPVRHISVAINRPPDVVYAFAANPANLPRWATGLGGAIRHEGGEWLADSPMGPIKIRFAAENRFGILDHDVVLPSGVTVHNPLRVIANGTGSELFFTLIRRPEMTDEEFARDAQWVANDLQILKGLLEKGE